MRKQITFEYDKKSYTLEFTRSTAARLEDMGFTPSDVEKRPLTMLPMFFGAAFWANHQGTKRRVVDEILQNIKKTTDDDSGESLFEVLGEMYADAVNTAFGDEDESKNVTWEKNW